MANITRIQVFNGQINNPFFDGGYLTRTMKIETNGGSEWIQTNSRCTIPSLSEGDIIKFGTQDANGTWTYKYTRYISSNDSWLKVYNLTGIWNWTVAVDVPTLPSPLGSETIIDDAPLNTSL